MVFIWFNQMRKRIRHFFSFFFKDGTFLVQNTNRREGVLKGKAWWQLRRVRALNSVGRIVSGHGQPI